MIITTCPRPPLPRRQKSTDNASRPAKPPSRTSITCTAHWETCAFYWSSRPFASPGGSLLRHVVSPWWLLLPLAVFIAVAIRHARVLRQKSLAERAVDVYRRGLDRIEDRWIGQGQQAPRADAASSLYATDLDLFGPGSLFELLSQARTCMGEDTLAHWLLSPSPVSELTERHAAVAELRNRLDLREDMAILGEDSQKLKTGVHPKALLQWAEAPAELKRQSLRWTALLLALLAIATAVVWGETGIKSPFILVLLVEGTIAFSLKDRLKKVFAGTDRALADLQLLSSLLARLEREQFSSPRLQHLKQELSSHSIPGSHAIARLSTIVQYIESRDNWFVRLLDIPLLYSLQVAFAAEAWRRCPWQSSQLLAQCPRRNRGATLHRRLQLRTPRRPLPRVPRPGRPPSTPKPSAIPSSPPPSVSATPSASAATPAPCSSAAPTCPAKARSCAPSASTPCSPWPALPSAQPDMQLTPLHVGASILVNDSLQEGSSRFYAEITRLRHICDLAEQHPPVLFLLDELLQGTNSKDRLIGAEAVVRELIDSGAIGIISTHDLALTDIQHSETGRLHNMHLQDEIEDGQMKFDFKLRDGVVTKSNGVELMRLIGLKV